MKFFKNFSGIIAWSLTLLNICICFLITREFYTVLSAYGVNEKTNSIFNILMILSGIFAFIFSLNFSYKFLNKNRLLKAIFLYVNIAVIFIGIFPSSEGIIRIIHWIFSGSFFIGYPLIFAIFGYREVFEVPFINKFFKVLGILTLIAFIVLFAANFKLIAQFVGILFVITSVSISTYFIIKEPEKDFNRKA